MQGDPGFVFSLLLKVQACTFTWVGLPAFYPQQIPTSLQESSVLPPRPPVKLACPGDIAFPSIHPKSSPIVTSSLAPTATAADKTRGSVQHDSIKNLQNPGILWPLFLLLQLICFKCVRQILSGIISLLWILADSPQLNNWYVEYLEKDFLFLSVPACH